MYWRIVEVPEGEEIDSDLTGSELIGISVILANYAGDPSDDYNVYFRAWRKIQPQVKQAIDAD